MTSISHLRPPGDAAVPVADLCFAGRAVGADERARVGCP